MKLFDFDPNKLYLPHNLYEMSNLGYIDDVYEVAVYDNEGPVPHMHIFKGNPKRPEWQTFVKLGFPEYFPHGKKHFSTMDSKLKKLFISFMESPSDEEGANLTNWQDAVRYWNRHSRYKLSYMVPMPDYSLL